ncbi:MAG: hypothetical protein WAW73_19010 [Rhodoferax sp.]
MDENQQFTFSRIQHLYAQSREIGSTAVKAVGVEHADVSCACGHQWTARRGSNLKSGVGGILVTCPACRASEIIDPHVFRL